MARTVSIPDRFTSVEQIVWSDARFTVAGVGCQGGPDGAGYEHSVKITVEDEDGVSVELDLGTGEAQRIVEAVQRAIAGVAANS